jgi:hypothetical protein
MPIAFWLGIIGGVLGVIAIVRTLVRYATRGQRSFDKPADVSEYDVWPAIREPRGFRLTNQTGSTALAVSIRQTNGSDISTALLMPIPTIAPAEHFLVEYSRHAESGLVAQATLTWNDESGRSYLSRTTLSP